MGALLSHLGYRVTFHRGGVHRQAPNVDDLSNHLVPLVHDLAADDHPDGVWYCDAGLGDALYEPMPLRTGTVQQGPIGLALRRPGDGVGDWRLVPDDMVGVESMSFERTPTTIGSFAARHALLSTSAESPFVRVVTVQRRHAHGSTVLRGKVVSRRDRTGISRQVVDRRAAWLELVADEFRLPLAALGVDPAAIDRLVASRVRVAGSR
jgi:N-hydroxyarylamine O-acetyltransferase